MPIPAFAKFLCCPGHGSGLCKKNICVYNFCRGVGVCEELIPGYKGCPDSGHVLKYTGMFDNPFYDFW
jgi:hypothetical protein